MAACFVALDFETADYGRDSACSVSLVRVEGSRIVARASRLIRPPRREFVFSYIHGITWSDVAREPAFGSVWRELRPLLDGAEFLAAHNAAFDRSVLNACCSRARIAPPDMPFRCTVRLARETWGLRPTRLPDVCAFLGLRLRHHDAASDAEACARIVIAVQATEDSTTRGRRHLEQPCSSSRTSSKTYASASGQSYKGSATRCRP